MRRIVPSLALVSAILLSASGCGSAATVVEEPQNIKWSKQFDARVKESPEHDLGGYTFTLEIGMQQPGPEHFAVEDAEKIGESRLTYNVDSFVTITNTTPGSRVLPIGNDTKISIWATLDSDTTYCRISSPETNGCSLQLSFLHAKLLWNARIFEHGGEQKTGIDSEPATGHSDGGTITPYDNFPTEQVDAVLADLYSADTLVVAMEDAGFELERICEDEFSYGYVGELVGVLSGDCKVLAS